MNTINFIKPVPHKTRRSIISWMVMSVCMLIGVAITIAAMHLNALSAWHDLQEEKEFYQKQQKNFDAQLAQKQQLTLQEKLLRQQQELITNLNTTHQQQLAIIKALHQATGTVTLQNIRLSANSIELSIACSNPTQAMQLLNQLRAVPGMASLALTSLQSQGATFLATLRGSTAKG